MNTFVLQNINDGVNKCGRSTSQEAYDEAFENLFCKRTNSNTWNTDTIGVNLGLVGDASRHPNGRLKYLVS